MRFHFLAPALCATALFGSPTALFAQVSTSTALSSAPNPSPAGQPVVLTANVTPVLAIPSERPVRGLAVDSTRNRVYVANWDMHSVSVLDTATNSVIGVVMLPPDSYPVRLAINESTNRIYAVNHGQGSVTVIDGSTLAMSARITVGLNAFGIAVNPLTNRIYVGNEGSDTLSVIDGATNQVVMAIGTCRNPIDVAINTSTDRVYVACQGESLSTDKPVSVIDAKTNTVVGSAGGGWAPTSIAVDAISNRVYVTNQANNLVVIDGVDNAVLATVPVGSFPIDVAVDENDFGVYVTNHYSNTVTVVDSRTNTISRTYALQTAPETIAMHPVTRQTYIGHHEWYAPSTVFVFDFAMPLAGTVEFFEGDSSIGVAPVNHQTATLQTSALTAGSHSLRATYSGSSAAAPSLSEARNHLVQFAFGGFTAPVDAPPALNRAKAGSSVAVKFSLNGYHGLNIFAGGYPLSQVIPCTGASTSDVIESASTSATTTLHYDSASDQYVYLWKTDKSWTGSCRQLTLRLVDGSDHSAQFHFVR